MILYEYEYIYYHLQKMSTTNTHSDANKRNMEIATIDQVASSFNNFISDMRKIDDREEHMNNIINEVSPSDEINEILKLMNSIMECKKLKTQKE